MDANKPPLKEPSSEQELALKERALTLKEQESQAKIEQAKRNALLSSPLLIALVSTVLATAIGAVLQGYASLNIERQKSEATSKLERQKFEFSLIQKALEEPDREEAAKQMLFLVNSGVIRDLDTEKITSLAETPEALPTITRPTATSTVEPGTEGTVAGNSDSRKNVRTEPTTAAPPIYEVAVGTRLTILESDTTSGYPWYRVYVESVDREGWIAAHLVAVD